MAHKNKSCGGTHHYASVSFNFTFTWSNFQRTSDPDDLTSMTWMTWPCILHFSAVKSNWRIWGRCIHHKGIYVLDHDHKCILAALLQLTEESSDYMIGTEVVLLYSNEFWRADKAVHWSCKCLQGETMLTLIGNLHTSNPANFNTARLWQLHCPWRLDWLVVVAMSMTNQVYVGQLLCL